MDKAKEKEERVVYMSQGNQPVLIVLTVLFMIGAFFLGSLWTKVQILEKGGAVIGQTAKQDKSASTNRPTSIPSAPQAAEVPKLTDEDHVRGDRKARLALIEYSDTECPFCKSFHSTAQRVVDEYKGKVMWVYRHYPLSFHANAQKEAEATECANELGGNDAFWKYLDTLFERTTSNGTGFALDNLVPLAKELGLNEVKFKECFDGRTFDTHVGQDMVGGTAAGVSGTPGTILLDTKTGKTRLISGAVPYDTIKLALDEMLK